MCKLSSSHSVGEAGLALLGHALDRPTRIGTRGQSVPERQRSTNAEESPS